MCIQLKNYKRTIFDEVLECWPKKHELRWRVGSGIKEPFDVTILLNLQPEIKRQEFRRAFASANGRAI